MYCEAAKNGAVTVAATIAGIKLLKFARFTVVDTDNSTYVALGKWLDGAHYEWAISTTTADNVVFGSSSLMRTASHNSGLALLQT